MENKIKILICDDQETDHKIIKKNFIHNTFLKDNVVVDSIYFYKTSPRKQATLLDLINDTFDYNILILDLNFKPEGIYEEDDKNGLIDEVLSKINNLNKDVLLLAISKDGGKLSDGVTSQGIPFIAKDADQNVITKFLKKHYDRYIRSLIISHSFQEIQRIKESIYNNEEIISLMGCTYSTESLLSHLGKNEFHEIFDDVPHLEHNTQFKFATDINFYFKEISKNTKWRDEIKKWEKRLEDVIIAHLLSEYCTIDRSIDDNYTRLINNSTLVWDTSIVPDFNSNESAIPLFLKKLNTRRLIAFMYLLCNYDQEKIYILLKGKIDNNSLNRRGDKTISNQFRYSYFLSGISELPDLNSRKRTYNKVREQLWSSEKKMLLKIAENVIAKVSQLNCSFDGFDLESFKKELNNLKVK